MRRTEWRGWAWMGRPWAWGPGRVRPQVQVLGRQTSAEPRLPRVEAPLQGWAADTDGGQGGQETWPGACRLSARCLPSNGRGRRPSHRAEARRPKAWEGTGEVPNPGHLGLFAVRAVLLTAHPMVHRGADVLLG